MTFIVDSSFLVALYNDKDQHHARARGVQIDSGEVVFVPDVVLPEVSHALRRRFHYEKSFAFVGFLDYATVRLAHLHRADLDIATEIARQYPWAEFDIVDLCIMAMAERLLITRIATFDTRDFSIYRPRHCDYLELLP